MLYRKVYCSQRLPGNDRDGKYVMTEMGFMFFHAATENVEWRFTKTLDDLEDWEFPAYWLEEVKEPTEEEIGKLAGKEYPNPDDESRIMGLRYGWEAGYKQALKDLKGE